MDTSQSRQPETSKRSPEAIAVGKRIKEIRADEKLTQNDFGKAIGVTPLTVSRWECGEYVVKTEQVQAICQKFGVTASWLLQGYGVKRIDDPLGQMIYLIDTAPPEILAVVSLHLNQRIADEFLTSISVCK